MALRERVPHRDMDVLLVEDDDQVRAALSAWLQGRACRVRSANSLAAARSSIEQAAPDLALIDLELPDGSGLDLLQPLVEGPGGDAVMISGRSSLDSAISALRLGASDFLVKPVDLERLEVVVEQSRRAAKLRNEVDRLRLQLKELGRLGSLVGVSKPMQAIYTAIERVARTDETVIILGATGTGKEVTAQTIHELSRRSNGPFIAVNCSAISPALLESEFFGHEKGAFTGADKRRAGLFEQAAGGTLFLDEITEMSVGLQAKLLRVLETRRVTLVGGNNEVAVDVRILAASNCDPHEAVRQNRLREDLLYRLLVFPIHLPPLCEREGDVPLLAEAILAKLNREHDGKKRFQPDALAGMAKHSWPGNVRELVNVVRRAYILADETIAPEHLEGLQALGHLPDRTTLKTGVGRSAGAGDAGLSFHVGESIAQVEQRLLEATLVALGGDKQQAAETLGISLKTLYSRLKVYGAAREAREA